MVRTGNPSDAARTFILAAPGRGGTLVSVSAPKSLLADEPYVNLETFKRDGNGVKTPVWVAPLDGKLVVMSAGNAFKVKRLRRDPRARVAACDFSGNVRGAWLEATGRILEDGEHVKRAHAALRGKYGWQMAIGDFFARISGRMEKRAYLEITVMAMFLLAAAAGCNTADHEVGVAADAQAEVSVPAEVFACVAVQATSYDQSCDADTDCVGVGVGDTCTSPCAIECPGGAAINRTSLPRYNVDLTNLPPMGFGCFCSPDASTRACCHAGTCSPLCASAAADGVDSDAE